MTPSEAQAWRWFEIRKLKVMDALGLAPGYWDVIMGDVMIDKLESEINGIHDSRQDDSA